MRGKLSRGEKKRGYDRIGGKEIKREYNDNTMSQVMKTPHSVLLFIERLTIRMIVKPRNRYIYREKRKITS